MDHHITVTYVTLCVHRQVVAARLRGMSWGRQVRPVLKLVLLTTLFQTAFWIPGLAPRRYAVLHRSMSRDKEAWAWVGLRMLPRLRYALLTTM